MCICYNRLTFCAPGVPAAAVIGMGSLLVAAFLVGLWEAGVYGVLSGSSPSLAFFDCFDRHFPMVVYISWSITSVIVTSVELTPVVVYITSVVATAVAEIKS